jgi:hypothetical protein
MEEFDYHKEVQIDESALDVAWLEQSDKMRKMIQIQAQLKKEYDSAAERLSVVRAELDFNIRADPEKYDLPKVTENAVQSAIILNDAYRKVSEEVLEARYEYESAKGGVVAFEHRKSALENLVKLLLQGYFAGPKMPRNLTDKILQKQQRTVKVTAGVGKRLKRKK